MSKPKQIHKIIHVYIKGVEKIPDLSRFIDSLFGDRCVKKMGPTILCLHLCLSVCLSAYLISLPLLPPHHLYSSSLTSCFICIFFNEHFTYATSSATTFKSNVIFIAFFFLIANLKILTKIMLPANDVPFVITVNQYVDLASHLLINNAILIIVYRFCKHTVPCTNVV